MKKNFLCLMGGVLLSLPLLFASCGNGDNALEEIINGGGSGSGGSSTIAVTGVTLEAALRFDKNVLTAQTLTATVSPAEATDKTVTWKSSDESVATVDASGKVTPKAKGIATITATTTDGGKTATSTIYVYDKIVDITAGAVTVTANEEWLINGDGTATAVTNGITIEDGATVTLNDINISKQIECSGTATIILADGSTNTVKGSSLKAGIVVGPSGTTLTIDAETAGDGKLNATGGSQSAGIGTSYNYSSDITCGAITIKGGEITATGGEGGAGIGTGLTILKNYTCGAITINGGTVTATGGGCAAGIGTGEALGSASNTCGVIAITANVTKVTATKGTNSPNSIGVGYLSNGTQNCGTITFGTAEVYNGGGDWTTYNSMTAGTYGGLSLAISTTTESNDTWTLTPVAP